MTPGIKDPVIGSMATFPARRRQLKKAVASIIGQVDRLHVYLNNYQSIPDFLQQDRVVAHLPRLGDLQELGKFYGAQGEHGFIFLLDDDIVYPKDYVLKMVFEIESHRRKAVVGVHGITFSRTDPSVIRNRDVCDFRRGCLGGRVDALGTGTLAYHSDSMRFEPTDARSLGMADVYFASRCVEKQIAMFSVPRRRGWLRGLPSQRKTQLYRRKKQLADIELDGAPRKEWARILRSPKNAHLCHFDHSKSW